MKKKSYYIFSIIILIIIITGFSNFIPNSPAEIDSSDKTISSKDYKIKVEVISDKLNHPWGIAFLPDGHFLVTERPGRLLHISKQGKIIPISGLPSIYNQGQGGLLDVILDPDYENNSIIYFSFSEPGKGNGKAGTAVAKASIDFDNYSLNDVNVIFRQEPKVEGSRHFGSRLVFSKNGKLFITLGERWNREEAQNLSNHLGKIIRINPDGSIPQDNPFIGRENAKPEIWSYGHRNIQGATLHPQTKELWIHEHGARGGDEINIPEAGKNYGWPTIAYGTHYWGGEIGVGTHKEGMEQPLYYWDPSIAPSGMDFYTGNKFPKWQGNLLIGALAHRKLVRVEIKDKKVINEEDILKNLNRRIRDVKQGPNGYIYLLTDHEPGELLKLQAVN